MKRFIGTLIAMLTITSSQASTTLINGGPYTETNHYGIHRPTATQKGPVLAKSRIPKPKLFRSNPHRKTHFLLIDDNDDVFVQDEDLATGYRRRDLSKVENQDGISEYVRWRLFLARQLALLKYREVQLA
jgi:hypothetical protein